MFTDLSQPLASAGTQVEIQPAAVTPTLSNLERMAVVIGINDGTIARRRSFLSNFLIFFAHARPISLADPRLEALRVYTELAQALFPRSIPATSLENAGFSSLQIRELLQMIDTGRRPQSA